VAESVGGWLHFRDWSAGQARAAAAGTVCMRKVGNHASCKCQRDQSACSHRDSDRTGSDATAVPSDAKDGCQVLIAPLQA
jgi:hypothetical protein